MKGRETLESSSLGTTEVYLKRGRDREDHQQPLSNQTIFIRWDRSVDDDYYLDDLFQILNKR